MWQYFDRFSHLTFTHSLKKSNENIIEGKILGFFKSSREDAAFITDRERDNHPYVSFNTPQEQIAMMEDPDFLHMTIRLLEGRSVVGHIIIRGILNPHKTIEFKRLVIYEKGNGYGREVLILLKRLCFERLGCHRLWLDVFEENFRAINLYESEGFTREGTFRDSFKDKNGYRSQHIYSMLEDEFNMQQSSK